MSDLKLTAQPRTVTGRKVRQIRSQGLVPVTVYGKNRAPINLQVQARQLELTLHHGGFSQLVQVAVEGGGSHNVLIREVQRHPYNKTYLHADFYAVNMNEKQEVSVQVVSHGKPLALTTGMMVLQTLENVHISALPADIPAVVEVDVTNLTEEQPITIGDLPKLAGVTYLGDAHEQIFTLLAAKVQEIEDVPTETAAEPEVVSRGKDEDEGEE
jgi:large subunit ribosomal protein L25